LSCSPFENWGQIPVFKIRWKTGVGLCCPKSKEKDAETALPFRPSDYLALVDRTGRAIREDKRGHIPNELPPILVRLNIDPNHWLGQMRLDGNRFGGAVGRLESLRAYAASCGQQWLRGIRLSSCLFVRLKSKTPCA
jgi:hypothetical protein